MVTCDAWPLSLRMAQRTRGSAEAEEARALLRASLTFALLESVICVFEAIRA